MTAISTAGRVFAAQLTRDLAARERAGAQALTPGTERWKPAFIAFAKALNTIGSPVRAA
jgi:hypothetical protein